MKLIRRAYSFIHILQEDLQTRYDTLALEPNNSAEAMLLYWTSPLVYDNRTTISSMTLPAGYNKSLPISEFLQIMDQVLSTSDFGITHHQRGQQAPADITKPKGSASGSHYHEPPQATSG